jgi:LIM homeobox protein 3/4
MNSNRRAKEKRLKKDAGRARWGQYFRNGGSNGGTLGVNKDGSRASKIEDLKDDLIIGFSSGKPFTYIPLCSLYRHIMRT